MPLAGTIIRRRLTHSPLTKVWQVTTGTQSRGCSLISLPLFGGDKLYEGICCVKSYGVPILISIRPSPVIIHLILPQDLDKDLVC